VGGADGQGGRGVRAGDSVALGVDASLNHDCTAVGIAKLLPDGRIAVGARIYAARRDAAAHVHFRTGRIEHKVVEQLIAGDLLHPDDPRRDGEPEPYTEQFVVEGIGYDPRYFNRSAELLSDEGLHARRVHAVGAGDLGCGAGLLQRGARGHDRDGRRPGADRARAGGGRPEDRSRLEGVEAEGDAAHRRSDGGDHGARGGAAAAARRRLGRRVRPERRAARTRRRRRSTRCSG
jgi:hypothetical protein